MRIVRLVLLVVVSNNMIRMASTSNPPVAWIRPQKINPLITTAVRTYANDNWTYTRTVLSYEEVKKTIGNKDQCIVDLRDPNEVASTGMIPSSINIPANYLDSALLMTDMDFQRVYKRKKPSKKHDLIFYCNNGQLAAVASNKAVKVGFLRVKTYVGGWEDWENQRKIDIQNHVKPEKEKIIKTTEPDDQYK